MPTSRPEQAGSVLQTAAEAFFAGDAIVIDGQAQDRWHPQPTGEWDDPR